MAGPAWLLAATVVLTVAVSAAATAAVRHRLPGGRHQLSLTGIILASLVLAAGAIAVAGSLPAGRSCCPATGSPPRAASRCCPWPTGRRCATPELRDA